MNYRIDIYKLDARVPVTVFYKHLDDALKTYCAETRKCRPGETVKMVLPQLEKLQHRIDCLEETQREIDYMTAIEWAALSVEEKISAIQKSEIRRQTKKKGLND